MAAAFNFCCCIEAGGHVNVTGGEALLHKTKMWANAQRDGRPAKHRWRPLFNAAKFR